jgi:uncharacterized integral membrane protein (TIGR00698 family)
LDSLKKFTGYIIAGITGSVAYFLSLQFSWVNALISALLAGILLGNILNIPSEWRSSISKSSGKLLEISLLFLAFDISLSTLYSLGPEILILIIGAIALILYLTVFFSNKFKCQGSTGWLIGFGTAICGSSAIAALSPGITEKKEDIGIAMAIVNLLGALGMLVFPWFLSLWDIESAAAGVLIGGTLHSVGNVAGAGYGMNSETGAMAIMIKMTRVALLSPALIFIRYLIKKEEGINWYKYFSLPWYLIGFMTITVFHSWISLPIELENIIASSGKLILAMAMAGIGFSVSFFTLYRSGKKGLVFGSFMFATQILLFSVIAWMLS